MRTFTTIAFTIGLIFQLDSQTPFKQLTSTPYKEPKPLQISKNLKIEDPYNRLGHPFTLNSVSINRPNHEVVKSFRITASGSLWIDFHQNDLWAQRNSVKELLEAFIPTQVQNGPWALDWEIKSENPDAYHNTHIRLQQTLAGVPIHHQDMILHLTKGKLRDMNGFAWTGKLPDKLPDPVPVNEAMVTVKNFLLEKNVSFQNQTQLLGMSVQHDEAQLIWYPSNGQLKLAYHVSMHPNMMDHWTVFIDATTLEVLEGYSELCSIAPLQLYDLSSHKECAVHLNQLSENKSGESDKSDESVVLDGATVITDTDLQGQNRTVNGYLVGSDYFMIDASRSGMYDDIQSIMPNEPVGVVWTVDALNSSPQQTNFEVIHVTNTNNNWKNLEVSAHFNGGEAYEYFRQKFNRNSINGNGGNIISIINVTDENDNDMDNAYWNGAAMFYGNGDIAFNAPLAKALDVSGHEISHGVIQNTANLEYVGQSGALNESYADIFGAMVDRNDWQMGEDVSNPAVFPTGALRDLSNPNNGGNSLGDAGWQPDHMNEYQNLPVTPEGDNGGVHVNSGIPNKAFFNLANNIGKDKAEQIYYKALTDYLLMSSQFIDMRNAADKAAGDIYGAGSTEVLAVRSAFDAVGIGAGQGEDYQDDLEVNPGADFIIATDAEESDLYWIPPDNPGQFAKMQVPAPISRPSFTDDGSACVYVDDEHNMIVIVFDWSQGLSYQWDYLEDPPQGIWQNVVVSKDGTKLAYTTSNLSNEINVFDFGTGGNDFFELYNPTSASGGATTGDVLYPDVMEWDYSGEFVMYDALNRIESSFGDGIEYWDISFLHAWDNAAEEFGSGLIGKLFSALPENISVGNPSFAKNSPYIITFDFVEGYYDIFGQPQADYWIKAANLEAGEVNDIYLNTTPGYPSYSRLDDQILFTFDDAGSPLLATIDVQSNDKTKPVSQSEQGLINGAQKGIWFATGARDYTAVEDLHELVNGVHIWPQPAAEVIFLAFDSEDHPQEYQLLDMTGRNITNGVLNADNAIQLHDLLPGSYMLRLSDEAGMNYTARFIKQ